jgi:hypothetical protein
LVFLLSGFIFDMVLHHLEVKGYDIWTRPGQAFWVSLGCL